MLFNPSNLTEFLSGQDAAALQETFGAPERVEVSRRELSRDPFPPGGELNYPSIEMSVEEFLRLPLEDLLAGWAPAIDQSQQEDDSSHNQGRSVDGAETVALTFTFGDTVAKFLAETIRIKPGEGETVSKTQMFLPQDYSSTDLVSLGNFIFNAARIWQQNTGRYINDENVNLLELVARGREGIEDVKEGIAQLLFGSDDESGIEIDHAYHYKQLYLLKFSSMQHAEAVKHWFYVSYSIEPYIEPDQMDSVNNRLPPEQLPLDDLWSLILDVLNLDDDDKSKFEETFDGERGALRNIVNNHYGCVIKEIRDAKLLPGLVPTADTEITTFGDIKTGG